MCEIKRRVGQTKDSEKQVDIPWRRERGGDQPSRLVESRLSTTKEEDKRSYTLDIPRIDNVARMAVRGKGNNREFEPMHKISSLRSVVVEISN